MKSFSNIFQVVGLLTRGERLRLGAVILMAIFMSLIEIIGVGSIMPFMTIAAKPESIYSNELLLYVYTLLSFETELQFIIFTGIAVLFFLILTNISQAIMHYIKVKFTSMRRHTLAMRLMKGYLMQDYVFFLDKSSPELVKNINIEIQQMIQGTLMQFVDLLSRIIQVFLLTAFLFIVNPVSTLGITGAVVVIYGTIYVFVRNKLKELGTARFELNSIRSKVLSEAFWGIKEVKITGTERVFLDSYKYPSQRMAINESVQEIIGDVPKFALETVAFSSIMLFVLVALIQSGNFTDVAGTVTLYAYAGYRMIPAIQGLFKALTKIKYGSHTAEKIVQQFNLVSSCSKESVSPQNRIVFKDKLTLSDISFAYPQSTRPVIEGLNLTIKANSLVGFAGTTGSGKTTLIDIILGLLHPEHGSITVDGNPVNSSNIRSWQMNVGYVPQNIFLSDATVAENIAFGVPKENINMEAVIRAASMAQIHGFITNELPSGYDTGIGERGIRLSGGQRQRLGIARALYRDPSVLIMDEATSALDGQTEKAVMEAIDSLQGTRTIILIAHRISTLSKCDVIYTLEKGKIISQETYDTLKSTDS